MDPLHVLFRVEVDLRDTFAQLLAKFLGGLPGGFQPVRLVAVVLAVTTDGARENVGLLLVFFVELKTSFVFPADGGTQNLGLIDSLVQLSLQARTLGRRFQMLFSLAQHNLVLNVAQAAFGQPDRSLLLVHLKVLTRLQIFDHRSEQLVVGRWLTPLDREDHGRPGLVDHHLVDLVHQPEVEIALDPVCGVFGRAIP